MTIELGSPSSPKSGIFGVGILFSSSSSLPLYSYSVSSKKKKNTIDPERLPAMVNDTFSSEHSSMTVNMILDSDPNLAFSRLIPDKRMPE